MLALIDGMKIFVVIAVFNRKEYTHQCIQLLQQQSIKNIGIVIVDDGSTDGTSEEIKAKYPEVNVVKGTGDWWWTKSMNEGCKAAIKFGADTIITLNNDTYFAPTLIESLVKHHHNKQKAIIGSLNLVKKEKEYIFFSGVKDIVWWKAKEVKYHKAFTPLTNSLSGLYNSKCLNGRGTLIPVSIFKEVEGYNEQLPQYASDYDLTLRIQEAGYDAYISYDSPVYSYIEETGGGKSFVKQSSWSFFQSFNNAYAQTSLKMWFRYYKSHAPKSVFLLGFAMQQLRAVYAFYKKRNTLSKI
ncbi:glycosyltransferase family 2 protein [Labilibacter marinus]|uniref:glycosyltransferase family 2 protein n=1 Tax=Labilibacter marinus TaxID=1477105 RepID=UPI0009501FEE|nr:glycosyltransferase family 2 protein [Labilibacter marinus]